jgi:hypothetical protein
MTKTIRNLIAAVLLIGASHGAMAGFESGNRILTKCESESYYDQGYCLGHLQAVSDTYNVSAAWHGFETDNCMPNGVTAGQLLRVWIKWANENPVKLHMDASSLVLLAYKEYFPCD